IVLDAREIHVDPADLASLPVPPFLQKRKLIVPPEVGRLGQMTFKGNFTGFINSFTTYGDASTAAGPMSSDISFDRDTVTGYFQLRGKLATTGFDLGKVLGTSAVGRIAMDTKVKAKGKDLNTLEAELEGSVPELGLAGVTIGGITLNGKLEKNLFNGELHCDDPKLKLDFRGLADLRGKWPVVDFNADVRRMDLRALGLIGGSGYSDLVMQIQAKGELAPDSLKGSVHMDDVSFCNDSLDLPLGTIDLVSEREGGVPVMRLQSSLADAVVKGPFYPTLLPQAVKGVLSGVFPSLKRPADLAENGQDLTFDATVKDAQPLLNVLVPGLIVSQGTRATGNFNDRNADLGLDAYFTHVGYKGFLGDSIVVSIEKNMDLLTFKLEGKGTVRKDSMEVLQLEITGKAYQDQVLLQADWMGRKKGNEGELAIEAKVNGPDSYTIQLKPSKLVFDRGEWANKRTAQIRVDSTTITVDTLELVNGDQALRIGGSIGKDPSMALAFDLHDVRLENLRPLYQGPALHGSLSGDGRVFDLYHNPYLLSYLCIDSLAFEDKAVGDLVFTAAYRNGEDAIDVNGTLQHDTLQALKFDGRLTPGQADELQVKLRMDHFDLRLLDPYLPDGISDVQGKVTGTINVTGKLAEPQVNGEALLTDAGLKINYLNTKYTFTHAVSIRPDAFFMDNVTLYDQQGGTAHASAFTVYHNGLKDWNFDVAVHMDSLLVLDTGPEINNLYYGRAIGRGDLNVEGYADNLGITVNAKTMPGTSLHFPLGASTDVSGIPFVRFTGKDDQIALENQAVDLSGVRMDMNIEVTPDAKFELIFDPTVGDIMRGRGQGNIAMSVTPSGDFSMKGDVQVVDGDYLFTLRNLVNKRFGIEPGGHINWFGDPFDALIDIDAVYRLRAALYDVMPPALRTEAYKKRVPVEVMMHLTQKLMNPDIGFEVRLPTVDEGVRTQVNSAMATTDDLNKQVFSLIVLNRFLPSDATAGPGNTTDIGGGTLATGTELLSNQVSNWLSGISRNVDLGVNWRTGDAISQDEFELALSTAIFNDRLQITTNFGLSYGAGGTQQGTNSFIGDFSA
ncbi:MAG: translocation/assembly module TamB domain-containing protein, partial [Flavobacteriales bacterium]